MMNASELISRAETLLLTKDHVTLTKATAEQLHNAVAGGADDGLVVDDVGQLELQYAALLQSLQVAGASQP